MSSYNLPTDSPVDNRFTEFLKSIKLWNLYAQNCEESIIEAIFQRIGTANKWCFECGAADGLFFSNTRRLIDAGWNAILVECDGEDYEKLATRFAGNEHVRCMQGYVVADKRRPIEGTLDEVLAHFDAPIDIDLVSLDIDSQEYFIINSMVKHKPRVLIVEYDPTAEPMFIPELRGPGQAGQLAMRYVCEARGYEVIGKTPTNLICVRKDLAPLLIEPAAPSGERHQVFAAGRWQDANAERIEVLPEEMEAAQAGNLPTRVLESEGRRAVRTALCLSIPRLGFLRAFEGILDVGHHVQANRHTGDGVFWHHALSRNIKAAVDFRFSEGGVYDFVLTADYDTYATADDFKKLAELLARSPEYDAIVPLQAKRGIENEILAGFECGNLTLEAIPITAGHFGFTLFRREFFERLPKPWFWEQPDKYGDWGSETDGRIDADIGFWRNALDAGLKVGLATQIVVGHGEEVVSYPKIEAGGVAKVYQTLNDWLSSRQKPAGIGVIPERAL